MADVRTRYTDTVLIECKDTIDALSEAVNEVINKGTYLSQSCKKRNLDYLMTRRLFATNCFQSIRTNKPEIGAFKQYFSPYMDFLKDVLEYTDEQILELNLPPDFLETVDYVIAYNLEKLDQEIIKAHYGFDSGKKQTFEAIGVSYNLTKERIRQRYNKAIEKLQTRWNKEYLLYGCAGIKDRDEKSKQEHKKVMEQVTQHYHDYLNEQYAKIENLGYTLDDLHFSTRSEKALKAYNISTLAQLVSLSYKDFCEMGLTPKTINEINQTVYSYLAPLPYKKPEPTEKEEHLY